MTGVRAGEGRGPGHRRGRRQRPRVPLRGRQEQQRHRRPPPLRHLRLRGLRHAGLRLPRRLQRIQRPGAGPVPREPVAEEPLDGRLPAVACRSFPGARVRRHRRVHAVAAGRARGGGGVQEAGRGGVLLRRWPGRGGAGARRREGRLQRGRLLLRLPDGRVAGRPHRCCSCAATGTRSAPWRRCGSWSGARAAVYVGRGHAFAHRPQSVEEDAEDAFNAMRAWLNDHLLA